MQLANPIGSCFILLSVIAVGSRGSVRAARTV
nr:MAG TPA_asm: hypothetical protein [Caudoviricetes sp.]